MIEHMCDAVFKVSYIIRQYNLLTRSQHRISNMKFYLCDKSNFLKGKMCNSNLHNRRVYQYHKWNRFLYTLKHSTQKVCNDFWCYLIKHSIMGRSIQTLGKWTINNITTCGYKSLCVNKQHHVWIYNIMCRYITLCVDM